MIPRSVVELTLKAKSDNANKINFWENVNAIIQNLLIL